MSTQGSIWSGTLVAISLAAACGGGSEQAIAPAATAQSTTGPSVAPGPGDPVWHYEGQAGPENWGTLSRKFSACGEGRSQSPIAISNPVPGSETILLQMLFKPATLKIAHHEHVADGINNRHTVQINYGGGDTLTIIARRPRLGNTPAAHRSAAAHRYAAGAAGTKVQFHGRRKSHYSPHRRGAKQVHISAVIVVFGFVAWEFGDRILAFKHGWGSKSERDSR